MASGMKATGFTTALNQGDNHVLIDTALKTVRNLIPLAVKGFVNFNDFKPRANRSAWG